MKSKSETLESLLRKIAAERKKLYEIYAAHGRTDRTVLAYSVRLDKLINKYMHSQMKINQNTRRN